MTEQYHNFYSEHLHHDFNLLVFGDDGYPLLIFPSAGGRYFEAKDAGILSSISDLINENRIKVFCPDSADNLSWFNNNISPNERVAKHSKYEKTILKDIVEFMFHESGQKRIAVCGFGFGAYHSLNLSFRFPNLISHCLTFSGPADIKQFVLGHYDDDVYFNNPSDFLPNLSEKKYLKHIEEMRILLSSGEFDPYLAEIKNLSGILNNKSIEHILDIVPNSGSSWNEWKKLLPGYLKKYF